MRERKKRRNRILAVIIIILIIAAVGVVGAYSYFKINKEEPVKVTQTSERDITKETVKIVTSCYPIQVATTNVCLGIENVSIENLTAASGGCVHDYTLTTDDMKKLDGADIFVINGAGLEPFMDQIKENYPDLYIVDSSADIELINDNPHIWMSVTNHRKQVSNIAAGIGAYYDANFKAQDTESVQYTTYEMVKKTIEKNETAYDDKLLALGNELRAVSSTKVGCVYLSDALIYLSKDCGLSVSKSLNLEDGATASASDIKNICDYMDDKKVSLIVTEANSDDSVATTIAKNAHAKVIYIDTFTTGEAVLDAYINVMESNKVAIDKAY